MWRTGLNLFHHAFDLPKLIHQIDLVVQSARCIYEDHIGTLLHPFFHSGIGYRSGVRVHSFLHNGYIHALAPDNELIHGCRAKRIRRTQ